MYHVVTDCSIKISYDTYESLSWYEFQKTFINLNLFMNTSYDMNNKFS